jgi:hypothetical protein
MACYYGITVLIHTYLVFVGRVERNLTNFWVFLAELVNGAHLELKAFEQGRL